MLTLANLKKIAAILLMICFVLPLSRCDKNAKFELAQAASSPASVPQATKRPPDPMYEDKYAYQNVLNDNPVAAATTIATFFWPLIFLVLARRKTPGFRVAMTFGVIELVLCTGSAYMLAGLTLFGELRYGGYLAYLAIGAYFTATLAQVLVQLWPRIRALRETKSVAG